MATASALGYRLGQLVAGRHDWVVTHSFVLAILLVFVALCASPSSGPSPDDTWMPYRW
jgi:hypothetical protein